MTDNSEYKRGYNDGLRYAYSLISNSLISLKEEFKDE